MATWIPNQPVFFGAVDTCNDDEITVNQIVDNTDTTQFQFNIEPCVSAQQEMSDPSFSDPASWTLGDNWSIATNSLCATGDTDAGISATSITQLDTTKYYQIQIIVSSISVGASFTVKLGGTIVGYITSTGTYTFYGFPTSFFGNTGLILSPDADGDNICIISTTAFEILTGFIFAIYNSLGVFKTQISYASNPTYFSFVDDSLTVTIDWAALGRSNDCFYICLLDPCENTGGQNYPPVIANQDMTWDGVDTPSWTLTALWSSAPTYVYATYAPLFANTFYQDDVFNSFTTTYSITINVSGGSGIDLDVFFGTNLVGNITSTGTHTITGIPVSTFRLTVAIEGGSNVLVNTISPVTVRSDSYTCNQQSNNFSLADYSGNCTKLINACNNENGLGFNFNGSGFTPRIRLEAKLKQAKYAQERTIYEDSLGKKGVVYFNGKKNKTLAIDLQPEYVHDFMRLMGGFDNFYIDGVLYFVEDDEYSVEYSDVSDELGKVRIVVSEKTQNVKNINCSDTENVCNLGTDYLLQGDDLAFRVVQSDGYGFVING